MREREERETSFLCFSIIYKIVFEHNKKIKFELENK
jgi:hypothetical protein